MRPASNDSILYGFVNANHQHLVERNAIRSANMGRSQHSRASSLAPGAARHKALLQQKKPSYRVVLEQVTEKKKKLLTHVSQHTKE